MRKGRFSPSWSPSPRWPPGIAANWTRANRRPFRPPPASRHFRVVVAGARVVVPEVKVIEYPAWLRSSQRPLLSQRSRYCHPGSAARRFSVRSGVTSGKVTSSARASAFVWVTQGITAGVSPSSGWQTNSRRMPLGS
jgi:hypothetical protein